jgi:arylsulfatase
LIRHLFSQGKKDTIFFAPVLAIIYDSTAHSAVAQRTERIDLKLHHHTASAKILQIIKTNMASIESFLFVLLGLCVLSSAETQINQSNQQPPNILLLFPDQWRADFDGRNSTNGHDNNEASENNQHLPLQLPNIRRLIREGTHFLHCYTPSPLCAPGRAAVASGRDYDDAGVPDNNSNDYNISIPTFYTELGKLGYHVMTAGKDDLTKATQMGTKTNQGDWRGLYHQTELGFHDAIRCGGKWDVVSTPKAPHERYGHWLQSQPAITLKDGTNITAWDAHVRCIRRGICTNESFPDRLYEDDWVTENAISLLRRKPLDRPWFLQVNFPGPHPPFLVTPTQHRQVDGRVFPPPVGNSDYVEPQECKSIQHPELSNIDRCSYAAECEHLDTLFGKILEELDNSGERNQTIVCFSSDHGEMLGDHGFVGKLLPWQGSVSVPLICSGPGIRSRQVIPRAVSTKDLAATFLDYAVRYIADQQISVEGSLPAPSTSRSLRKLLETGHDESYHDFIHSGLMSWRMVVESSLGLKLVCCRGQCKRKGGHRRPLMRQTHEVLVFNTTNDPFDMFPLNRELPAHEIERLVRALPPGFCEGDPIAVS